MAYCYLQRDRGRDAVNCLIQAIKRQPDDYVSRTYLGSMLMSNGIPGGAEHLQQALALSPSYVPAWGVKIKTLIKEGDLDAARRLVDNAKRQLNPEKFEDLQDQLPSFESQ